MLLAVEGGGFFSSSACGYSKGLTLLLLGQKNEEKLMKVLPWNHYQLVHQEPNPDLQLASCKNRLVRRCASFVCFGRAASGLENPSPLKVGPTQHQEPVTENTVFENIKNHVHTNNLVDDCTKSISLKSSLKKPRSSVPVIGRVCNERDALCEKSSSVADQTERRKVQWTDLSGGELFDIREFEPSVYSGSDDECDNGNGRTCSCWIM